MPDTIPLHESGAADSVAHPGLWLLYRLLGQLAKAVLETALNQEMTGCPGHLKHGPVTSETGNVRNGARSKTVR